MGSEMCIRDSAYGSLSVKDAFAKSSNIAVSKTVVKHFKARPEKFLQYITNFGLSEPLNFQLRGAERPFFRSPGDKKHWNDAALAKMSFGYESLISPLQTLAFYNAVANGGKMIQPIIVKEVRANDQVAKTFEPRVIREKICSDETIVAAREMLEAVVENPKGTAHKIQSPLYKIAGKTGTAHKFQDGHWINNAYYTSFAGYFPADRPQFTCVVLVRTKPGSKQIYGGLVAAPVFKEIATRLHAMYVVSPQPVQATVKKDSSSSQYAGNRNSMMRVYASLGMQHIDSAANAPYINVRTENATTQWQAKQSAGGGMPDLRDLTLRDAVQQIEKLHAGIQIEVKGKGKIKNQSVQPGEPVTRGSKLILELN